MPSLAMTIEGEAVKGLFDRLPSWARHSITLMCFGAVVVTGFFTFVRDPQAHAAAADARQDATLERQQTAIDKLNEVVMALQQSNALLVQSQGAQERTNQDNARRLDRIEDKIDRLRQGR